MVTDCDHDWHWLEQPITVVTPLGSTRIAFNVECTRCGAHNWAHGRAPNAAPITVTITPTTGKR